MTASGEHHSARPATEFGASRLSRRRLLHLAGAGAGVLAAAAALPSTGLAATTPAGAPRGAFNVRRQTDELVVAFSLDPGHFDPRVEAGVPGFSMMYPHMFETIVWRRGNTTPEASLSLAESWEQVNPTTLRFKLRQGIKFHNGEDFDADAVKFSHESYIAPESKHPIKTGMGAAKQLKVVDKYTIDYITEKPYRPLLRLLTFQAIMSPRAVSTLGTRIATNPVGTGPFKFVEYVPGSHVLMERNPDYWGQKPAYDRLRIRFIPENGTRMAALEAGEVMMVSNVPPEAIRRIESSGNLQMVTSPTNRVMYVPIRTDRPPFNDKRARQALNYAIDKDALAGGILNGLATVPNGPMAPDVFGASTNLTPYKYDPDRAKKLLADAGATGAQFNFGIPIGRYLLDKEIGEAIAGFWTDAGLNVSAETTAWSAFVTEFNKFEQSRWNGYFVGWGVVTGEPEQQMREHYYSTGLNRTAYSNPEVDKLIDEGAETFDLEKAKAAYQKAQEIVWDECPWVFLYLQPDLNAVNKRLRGFEARPDEWLILANTSM